MSAIDNLTALLFPRSVSARTPPFQRSRGGSNPFPRGASPVGPVPGPPVAPQQMPQAAPPIATQPGQPPVGAQAPNSTPQTPDNRTLKQKVWENLTNNPNFAATALAAAQQLTRPRYPGETGMGNAVSAVTSGLNQMSQQRALQQERERLYQEWKMKQDELELKRRETENRESETKNQNKRRDAQTEHDWAMEENMRKKHQSDREVADRLAGISERNASTNETNAKTNQQNAQSLERARNAEIVAAQERLANAGEQLKLEQKKLEESQRQFDKGLTQKDAHQKQDLAVRWSQVGVAKEALKLNEARKRSDDDQFSVTQNNKLIDQAADDVSQEVATTLGKRPSDAEIQTKIRGRYQALKALQGAGPSSTPAQQPQYKEGDIVTNAEGKKLQLRNNQWLPVQQ